ncbi:MAG: hypothetical protein KDA45_06210 [Planctomycetales bacterium]|nr:hypothetical protein [Planctomycetales bacterium]
MSKTRKCLILLGALLGNLGCGVFASGQLSAERLFPPAAAIGCSTKLKVEGKFPHWPVQIACDRADEIQLEPGEKSGELHLHIADNAAPGVVWVRLWDDHSASSLLPLLLEPGTVQAEQEPNDSLEQATPCPLPTCVVGRLEKRGDVDVYHLRLQAGQQLVASVIANQVMESPLDAVLQLSDRQGNVLAQSDDERGLDPQLVFQSPSEQDVLLRIFGFPETPNSTIGFSGEASFVYAIHLTTGAFVDHTLPLLLADKRLDDPQAIGARAYGWNLPSIPPNVQLSRGQSIVGVTGFVAQLPGWQWLATSPQDLQYHRDDQGQQPPTATSLPLVFSGHILQPRETDALEFPVQAGERYRAEVYSRRLGMTLDSVLRVVEADSGKELAHADDISRNNYDAALEFVASNSGLARLQLSDLADSGSLRHAYSLLVSKVAPQVALSVAQEPFVIEAGKPLQVTVAIERQSGYGQRLQITALDLPPGVAAKAVFSEPKGKSSKAVTLELTCQPQAAAFQGRWRIVGQVVDEQGVVQPDSLLPCTYQLRPMLLLPRLWLTVKPAPNAGAPAKTAQ